MEIASKCRRLAHPAIARDTVSVSTPPPPANDNIAIIGRTRIQDAPVTNWQYGGIPQCGSFVFRVGRGLCVRRDKVRGRDRRLARALRHVRGSQPDCFSGELLAVAPLISRLVAGAAKGVTARPFPNDLND